MACVASSVNPFIEKKCQWISIKACLEQHKSNSSGGVNKPCLYYARHKSYAIFRSVMLSLQRKMLDVVALILSLKPTVLKQAFHLSEKALQGMNLTVSCE